MIRETDNTTLTGLNTYCGQNLYLNGFLKFVIKKNKTYKVKGKGKGKFTSLFTGVNNFNLT